MRLCRWQLVRELRPLTFHDRSHLIRHDGDLLNLEHVLVQSPQVRRGHNLATDDARQVETLIPYSWAGGAQPGPGRRIGQARAAEAVLKGISNGGIGEAEADVELL